MPLIYGYSVQKRRTNTVRILSESRRLSENATGGHCPKATSAKDVRILGFMEACLALSGAHIRSTNGVDTDSWLVIILYEHPIVE